MKKDLELEILLDVINRRDQDLVSHAADTLNALSAWLLQQNYTTSAATVSGLSEDLEFSTVQKDDIDEGAVQLTNDVLAVSRKLDAHVLEKICNFWVLLEDDIDRKLAVECLNSLYSKLHKEGDAKGASLARDLAGWVETSQV